MSTTSPQQMEDWFFAVRPVVHAITSDPDVVAAAVDAVHQARAAGRFRALTKMFVRDGARDAAAVMAGLERAGTGGVA